MAAYYNEHDPFAAAWLRQLLTKGLIADGEVDTRSIVDVRPDDVRGFTQCHFFAGIGGWSAALRLAGWPDDRPVWTGSCPCQPFSTAGSRSGTDDPRHLWPTWFGLIRECRPAVVFGEQVSSTDGRDWLDVVYADLEASNYAVGAIDLPAASVGAPHIRQRLWFVADDYAARLQRLTPARLHAEGPSGDDAARRGQPGGMGDTTHQRHGRTQSTGRPARDRPQFSIEVDAGRDESRGLEYADERRGGRHAGVDDRAEGTGPGARRVRRRVRDGAQPAGAAGELGHAGGARLPECERAHRGGAGPRDEGRAAPEPNETPDHLADATRGGFGVDGRAPGDTGHECEPVGGARNLADAESTRGRTDVGPVRTGPPTGLRDAEGQDERWARLEAGRTLDCGADRVWAAEWIFCRDNKWRPVEPGAFPLAHGVPARVGRLRGYGNAIVPQVAATVIASFLDIEAEA